MMTESNNPEEVMKNASGIVQDFMYLAVERYQYSSEQAARRLREMTIENDGVNHTIDSLREELKMPSDSNIQYCIHSISDGRKYIEDVVREYDSLTSR